MKKLVKTLSRNFHSSISSSNNNNNNNNIDPCHSTNNSNLLSLPQQHAVSHHHREHLSSSTGTLELPSSSYHHSYDDLEQCREDDYNLSSSSSNYGLTVKPKKKRSFFSKSQNELHEMKGGNTGMNTNWSQQIANGLQILSRRESSATVTCQSRSKRPVLTFTLDLLSADVLQYILSFLPCQSVHTCFADEYKTYVKLYKAIQQGIQQFPKRKTETLNSKQKKQLKKLIYSNDNSPNMNSSYYGIFSLCFTKKYFLEELYEQVSFWQFLCEHFYKVDISRFNEMKAKLMRCKILKENDSPLICWKQIFRYYNEYIARWETDMVYNIFKISRQDTKISRIYKEKKTSWTSQLAYNLKEETLRTVFSSNNSNSDYYAITSTSFEPNNLYYFEFTCKYSTQSRIAVGVVPNTNAFYKDQLESVNDTSQDNHQIDLDSSFSSVTSNHDVDTHNAAKNGSRNEATQPFNPLEYRPPTDVPCMSLLENTEEGQLFLPGDKIGVICDYSFSEKNVLKLYFCLNWDSTKEYTCFKKTLERIRHVERDSSCPFSLHEEKVCAYLLKYDLHNMQKEVFQLNGTTVGHSASSSRSFFSTSTASMPASALTALHDNPANHSSPNLVSSSNKTLSNSLTNNNGNTNSVTTSQSHMKNNLSNSLSPNPLYEERIMAPFKKHDIRLVYFIPNFRNSTEQHFQFPKCYKSNQRRELISFLKVNERVLHSNDVNSDQPNLPSRSLNSSFDPSKERPTSSTAELNLPDLKLCMSSLEVGDAVFITKPSLPYPPLYYHLLVTKQHKTSHH
ncbi:hypothetical protein FDP41_006091 [Naegleria fowleri]|uniref:Uncharacterized protein n=1 Tax=Naegleria fowleri TaxID=5763 RepID=A0A6A5BBZ8_NAEFO|nr:uncharacterized protein FDP41_006091 [Naegleria fowleri]KAF0974617.1 hypothetical protein FDP41_006091 [Naegleria fowleri]CAG4712485.1 unnamed protein product [Naegleria fowleri]